MLSIALAALAACCCATDHTISSMPAVEGIESSTVAFTPLGGTHPASLHALSPYVQHRNDALSAFPQPPGGKEGECGDLGRSTDGDTTARTAAAAVEETKNDGRESESKVTTTTTPHSTTATGELKTDETSGLHHGIAALEVKWKGVDGSPPEPLMFVPVRGVASVLQLVEEAGDEECKAHDFASRLHHHAASIPIDTLVSSLNAGTKVVVCGHSLGGSIATLLTHRLLADIHAKPLEWQRNKRLLCVTFGAPSVAPPTTTKTLARLDLGSIFRAFVHTRDIVARCGSLPGAARTWLRRHLTKGDNAAAARTAITTGLEETKEGITCTLDVVAEACRRLRFTGADEIGDGVGATIGQKLAELGAPVASGFSSSSPACTTLIMKNDGSTGVMPPMRDLDADDFRFHFITSYWMLLQQRLRFEQNGRSRSTSSTTSSTSSKSAASGTSSLSGTSSVSTTSSSPPSPPTPSPVSASGPSPLSVLPAIPLPTIPLSVDDNRERWKWEPHCEVAKLYIQADVATGSDSKSDVDDGEPGVTRGTVRLVLQGERLDFVLVSRVRVAGHPVARVLLHTTSSIQVTIKWRGRLPAPTEMVHATVPHYFGGTKDVQVTPQLTRIMISREERRDAAPSTALMMSAVLLDMIAGRSPRAIVPDPRRGKAVQAVSSALRDLLPTAGDSPHLHLAARYVAERAAMSLPWRGHLEAAVKADNVGEWLKQEASRPVRSVPKEVAVVEKLKEARRGDSGSGGSSLAPIGADLNTLLAEGKEDGTGDVQRLRLLQTMFAAIVLVHLRADRHKMKVSHTTPQSSAGGGGWFSMLTSFLPRMPWSTRESGGDVEPGVYETRLQALHTMTGDAKSITPADTVADTKAVKTPDTNPIATPDSAADTKPTAAADTRPITSVFRIEKTVRERFCEGDDGLFQQVKKDRQLLDVEAPHPLWLLAGHMATVRENVFPRLPLIPILGMQNAGKSTALQQLFKLSTSPPSSSTHTMFPVGGHALMDDHFDVQLLDFPALDTATPSAPLLLQLLPAAAGAIIVLELEQANTSVVREQLRRIMSSQPAPASILILLNQVDSMYNRAAGDIRRKGAPQRTSFSSASASSSLDGSKIVEVGRYKPDSSLPDVADGSTTEDDDNGDVARQKNKQEEGEKEAKRLEVSEAEVRAQARAATVRKMESALGQIQLALGGHPDVEVMGTMLRPSCGKREAKTLRKALNKLVASQAAHKGESYSDMMKVGTALRVYRWVERVCTAWKGRKEYGACDSDDRRSSSEAGAVNEADGGPPSGGAGAGAGAGASTMQDGGQSVGVS